MVDLYRFKQLILNDNTFLGKTLIEETRYSITIEAYENMGTYKAKIFISCNTDGLAELVFATVPVRNRKPAFFDAEIDLRMYLSRFSDRNNLFAITGRYINGENYYALSFNDWNLRKNIKTAEDAYNYIKEGYNCMMYSTSTSGYLNRVVETIR